MKLYEPSTIRTIREEHGFRFTKSLGQNFLIDKNIIDYIVDGAEIEPEDTVIEIGPGVGAITYEAAKVAKKVIAIELDKNLIPILNETLREFDNVEIINEDVLKLDINKVIADNGGGQVKILGNLPYYITTPIIMKLFEEGVKAQSITIMMQKEVADRINAKPKTKAYGGLSVAVQYYCTVEKLADVPRSSFVPQPNIDSVVIRLDIRKSRPVEITNEKLFFDCIRAGFGQRRKTLFNSLQTLQGASKEIIRDSLGAAGVDPIRRAETLTIEEFAKISDEVDKRL